MRCPVCDQAVEDAPTTESCPTEPVSIYGLTKKYQEDICRLMSKVQRIPVVALRYFNVYGPRQAPGNSYTGVIVAFINRLASGEAIPLYEEGLPRRDFVNVSDVVAANIAALKSDDAGRLFRVYNVGSGRALTLKQVAQSMCSVASAGGRIEITARHRIGDILSCYADLSATRKELDYEPRVSFEEGVGQLMQTMGPNHVPDKSDFVEAELRRKGLLLNG